MVGQLGGTDFNLYGHLSRHSPAPPICPCGRFGAAHAGKPRAPYRSIIGNAVPLLSAIPSLPSEQYSAPIFGAVPLSV